MIGCGESESKAPQVLNGASISGCSSVSITVEDIDGAEYRIDDGEWQESNLFEGLTPDTAYIVRVRLKETEDKKASPSVYITAKTTARNINVPPLSAKKITTDSIEFVEIAGAEYKLENGAWQNSCVFEGLTAGQSYNVSARYRAAGNIEAGSAVTEQFTCLEKNRADVVLLAGQSNAVGFSPVKETSLPTYENIMYYGSGQSSEANAANSDKWTFVKPGLGKDTTRFGPEMGMSEVFSERYPEEEVSESLAIIKYAWGGTALWGLWTPPSAAEQGLGNHNNYVTDEYGRLAGRYYHGMIKTFTEQLAVLEAKGYDVNVLGFVWMQGETDAQNLNMAELYDVMLDYLIRDVRSDLKDETLPVVIGQINTKVAGYEETVIAAQRKVCLNTENCFYVTTSDLEMGLLDWWHFRASSMLELGRRFASALLNYQSSEKPVKVAETEIITGKGVYPTLPQTVKVETYEGYTKMMPVKFDPIDASCYENTGVRKIVGYVLYGENKGLKFQADLKVLDGAAVDGVLNDSVWQKAQKHHIVLYKDIFAETRELPYFGVEADFMAYAGEGGLYFAFSVKDTKIVSNYMLNTEPDWQLYLNDGVEIYIDASGGSSQVNEKSLAIWCTASGILRVYDGQPNGGWSLPKNQYNSQKENIRDIRRAITINGTPNQSTDTDEGYIMEFFVPYSIFGTDKTENFRIAAAVRSRANIPGGNVEEPFGVYVSGDISDFSNTNVGAWIPLFQAM